MERLTRKFVQKINGRNEIEVVLPAERTVQEAVNRLAELEDEIENGTLVELPAPLGSELWTIEYPTHKKGKETVTVLSVKNATVERVKYPLSLSNLDMVGKYYFLTREEAEKRLEELRK